MNDCIYCNKFIENNHEVILSNDYCIYSLLKDQEIKGVGIIIPRDHKETVFDLKQEEWNATFQLLQEVKTYIDKKYNPDGYNVGWNSGHVGGQHVFHSHLHIIPRFSDEPLSGKGIRYMFKSEKNKLNKNI